jgi:hypothetical protein
MTRTPTPGAAFATSFVPTVEAACPGLRGRKGERTWKRRLNGGRLRDAGPVQGPEKRLRGSRNLGPREVGPALQSLPDDFPQIMRCPLNNL